MSSEHILSPDQNALNSLHRMARELTDADIRNIADLKGILVWGWHAVDILAYMRLQPARDTFDAWMQDYLHKGEPTLNVQRDAHWDEKRHLSLLELIDIFSETDLPILKPDFYQGWQDRTVRCHELREHIAGIVGGAIAEEQREKLLLLLAAYNRLIHLSAEVSIDVSLVWEALPSLFAFIDMLIDKSSPAGPPMLEALQRCQSALKMKE